jgi:hypothetical protein
MFKFETKVLDRSQIRPKNVPKLMIEKVNENQESDDDDSIDCTEAASIRSYSCDDL